MDMYNVSEHGNTDTYVIQGTESNLHLRPSLLENTEAMYNEAAPEYVFDQGIYYPTATNYGYYCTGFESPGDWDDHHRAFGLDGQDVQYPGAAQTEGLPYVYYTPSYGYAQSPYNPYNPYIPGAMIGVDGPFVGTQQYYSIPPFQNPISAPAYFPYVVQSSPDIMPNTPPDPLLDTGTFIVNRPDGPGIKHNLPQSSANFTVTPPRPASNQTHSMTRVMEGSRVNAGSSKQPSIYGSVTSGSYPSPASTQIMQGKSSGSTQTITNGSNGRVISNRNQLKVGVPVSNGLPDFGSSVHGQPAADKFRPKFPYDRDLNDVNDGPDTLGEQNRGPRTSRSRNQLAVKAYATQAGDNNAQGNPVIHIDQYNRDDFPLHYADVKFFVIKSYSEDDVHKSIKYNVWSSTPNGNKRLEIAFADAQRTVAGDPRGCPVFLFFSVNASGQFCGVAEMTGPVDFHKDMDFWQQDKWSGSFPVEWHIIKDVPNTNFRHIILENNENKPVTNSRDTQEIRYKQGLEMLKIFKNYTLKTSLLDDFTYYENRQKLMMEEKARLLIKSYESPFYVPASFDPPRKLNYMIDFPRRQEENVTQTSNNDKKATSSTANQVSSNDDVITKPNSTNENAKTSSVEPRDDAISTLKIGSLTLNTKKIDSKPLVAAKPVDVVTVGSMPVKVNGFAENSGILTVGTIPIDPRALQLDKTGVFGKGGSQN